VIAGITSIICLMVLLKYWKPKSVWRFKEEPPQTIDTVLTYSGGQVIRAWTPFFIMTIMIIAWGLEPVKSALNSISVIRFTIPGLQDAILKADESPLGIKPFELNYLSNPGTALLLATLIAIPLTGLGYKKGVETYLATLSQLKFPMITIASLLGFAFVANNSGMSTTMAMALASTGFLFPFFSPILGWLGVFLTGSDTSSNALFCKLQYTSADAMGVDPVITVSANASGGVTGKMISPQSIAIGAAAVGLVGKESDLFRFTLKHSFIMLLVICVLTLLQAYVIKWIVPAYTMTEIVPKAGTSNTSGGFVYLLILALVLGIVGLMVMVVNRKKA
jgi:lactate permease